MTEKTEIESLESLSKKPKKIKKPTNNALWVAYIFFNVVILIFDAIASYTVYTLTKNIGYAIVTFLAGFVPLLMHEFLYLRAYASQGQRVMAMFGAAVAALTVIVVAVLSAGVNFALVAGYTVNANSSNLVILLIVVFAAFTHAILAALYFYVDDGIKATHSAAENLAWHESRLQNLDRAEQVLAKMEGMRNRKMNIASRFGGEDGRRALEILLSQFGDADGDGIPDIIDPVDNRTNKPFRQNQSMNSFASETKQVKPGEDFPDRQSQNK